MACDQRGWRAPAAAPAAEAGMGPKAGAGAGMGPLRGASGIRASARMPARVTSPAIRAARRPRRSSRVTGAAPSFMPSPAGATRGSTIRAVTSQPTSVSITAAAARKYQLQVICTV